MIVPTFALVGKQDQYSQHLSKKTQDSFRALLADIQAKKRRSVFGDAASAGVSGNASASGFQFGSSMTAGAPLSLQKQPPQLDTKPAERSMLSVNPASFVDQNTRANEIHPQSSHQTMMMQGSKNIDETFFESGETESESDDSSSWTNGNSNPKPANIKIVTVDQPQAQSPSSTDPATYWEIQTALHQRNRNRPSSVITKRPLGEKHSLALKKHIQKKQGGSASDRALLGDLEQLLVKENR
eukprot:CAMPEP_0184706178 /NCGR_PEP_ID=MMETSP0313-20130426/36626_1 /TAXON_ID=2792 /ORGANISM="Porphyridium aerugineum, Strain SAG 1380-2" /LENGTH=240 /DNA_ID=CAMNT_0027167725 /DNA_START=989 /DNA_END=1711 /DNA_ORIENTATION=+